MSLGTTKQYCTCRPMTYEFTGLWFLPNTKRDIEQWVHSVCYKPSREMYEWYRIMCAECMKVMSNPWHDLCRGCYEGELPYLSWSIASREAQKFYLTFTESSSTIYINRRT